MQHRAEREFKRHKEEIELLEMERRRQLDEDMRHREEVNKMKFKKEWEYIESEKRKLNLKQYRYKLYPKSSTSNSNQILD